ncbi:hypothetical protein D187_004637 [Cystobacter fuscus DSM 2262]|uniref:Uncharacterized protein n=1 Tax=Cystobacter fuscus (strain ATCC 25194 / DSM 2262 / NBRC 100088 / M29) TaxID=1242864 RepID=S9Q950_CYSF2|nr:hypothetical protein D187_004637 [Cystobacter fuscus DSM 2262]
MLQTPENTWESTKSGTDGREALAARHKFRRSIARWLSRHIAAE